MESKVKLVNAIEITTIMSEQDWNKVRKAMYEFIVNHNTSDAEEWKKLMQPLYDYCDTIQSKLPKN